MKISWSTGIVVTIIAFIGFILFFVIKMSTNQKYEHDLVTEGYYKEELSYQQNIKLEENTIAKNIDVRTTKTENGLELYFVGIDSNQIKGKVFLYRPSNKKLDLELPFETLNATFLVPDKHLLDGRWNIIISWKVENEDFRVKKEIFY
ncbi:MAG: FixH family protein [Polaribacter sp.]|nr:FixH family protein [Polaribacter sp.]